MHAEVSNHSANTSLSPDSNTQIRGRYAATVTATRHSNTNTNAGVVDTE